MSPNPFPGLCWGLQSALSTLTIRPFFKLAQAWPEGIQAMEAELATQLHLYELSGEGSSGICTGQRAESRFTALDGDTVLVCPRKTVGRGIAGGEPEAWKNEQRHLQCPLIPSGA